MGIRDGRNGSWAVIRAAQSRPSVFSPPSQGRDTLPEACLSRFSGGSCVAGGGVDRLGRVVQPSHRSALEGYAVRIIEETVEDGVAEGGIADDIVPVLDGDLAGEQRATAGIAVVEDFEEVVPPLA